MEAGKELLQQTALQIKRAVDTGISAIEFMPDEAYMQKLTQSVWVFSGAKTFHQLQNMAALLTDKEGNLKPFYKFRDEALVLHPKYNETYLKAEYNHAVSSSQMAGKWKQYEQDGDRYNLQYRTAGDERVRKTHSDLNNTTLPINDAFWNEYYPPNGWNCRCSAIQVKKGKYKETNSKEAIENGKIATTQINKNGVNTLEMFRTNTAKEAVVFPKTHPYYNIRKNDFTDVKQFSKHLFYRNKYEKIYGDRWKEDFAIAEMIDIPENLALEDKLLYIAKEIGNIKTNEVGFALNNKGNIVQMFSGLASTLEAKMQKDTFFIHNHPNNKHLSYPDLIAASRYNISEIIATGKDVLYRIKRPANGWPSTDAIASKFLNLEEIAEENENLTTSGYFDYLIYGISLDIFKFFGLDLKQEKL